MPCGRDSEAVAAQYPAPPLDTVWTSVPAGEFCRRETVGVRTTTLATIAIDEMAKSLTSKKGAFRAKLFGSLNDDPALRNEILL